MLPKNNLLFSYYMLRGKKDFLEAVMALTPYVNVMIDSGAFSDYSQKIKASKSGATHSPITVQEYIDICKNLFHGKVWQYVMLDVIGNSEKSRENLDQMFQAGLKPMPVLVTNEKIETILELVEKYNRRVCVAGGVGSPDKYIYKRYQSAYKASQGKALIHGLGFLRWPDVFQLPLATGDSSSSSSGARFGHIARYDKKKGLQKVQWKDFLKAPHKFTELLSLMRNCNITTDMLKNPNSYRTSTSIPAMFELFATSKFMEHSYEQGFGMFSAFSTIGWLNMYTSVVASSEDNSFDYPLAIHYYEKNRKAPIGEFCKFIDETYSKKTKHSVNILNDNQQFNLRDSSKN